MSGYMRNATPIPGQYERKAAKAVSSRRPKIRILFLGEEMENEVIKKGEDRWQPSLKNTGCFGLWVGK